MKRLISLGLALAMSVTTLGCAKSMTPEERFDAAMQQGTNAASMECAAKAKVDINVSGSSIGMDMDMIIRINKIEEKTEMEVKSDISVMGQQMQIQNFYKDSYLYTSIMDQKVKEAMPLDEMMKQIQSQNMGGLFAADMSQLDMKKVDKDFEFTYTVKPENLNSYIEEAQQLLSSGLSEAGNVTITSMSGTILVDAKNNLKRQTVVMVMQMDMMGQAAELKMDMSSDYTNIGGKVVIEFPTDLDSYVLAA